MQLAVGGEGASAPLLVHVIKAGIVGIGDATMFRPCLSPASSNRRTAASPHLRPCLGDHSRLSRVWDPPAWLGASEAGRASQNSKIKCRFPNRISRCRAPSNPDRGLGKSDRRYGSADGGSIAGFRNGMLSNGSTVTDRPGDRRAVFDADHLSGMEGRCLIIAAA